MEEITVDTIDIDGKEFFLVDKIDKYNYFAEIENPENICILKDKVEDEEELYVSLDDDKEVDKALILYYEKYGNTN